MEIEPRYVNNRPGSYVASNEDLVDACDENTIGGWGAGGRGLGGGVSWIWEAAGGGEACGACCCSLAVCVWGRAAGCAQVERLKDRSAAG